MKTLIRNFLILIFLLSTKIIYCQKWNWVSIGGSVQSEIAKCLTYDTNHNLYVVGTFGDSVFSGSNKLYSHGGVDIFIAKYDSAGNLLWSRSGGGPGNDGDFNMGVAFDNSDNIHIACRSTGNITFEQTTLVGDYDNMTLLKYDSNGNLIYARIYGGNSYDAASDIDIDSQGNVYVTGGFHTTLNFGSVVLSGLGHGDIYLAKFNPQGTIIWARQAGGVSYDNSGGVAADEFGNVYITGYYTGNGMFGTVPVTSDGTADGFIAKYDSSGAIQWVKTMNGTGTFESGNRIDVDAFGNIYQVCQFADSVTIGSNTFVSHGMYDICLSKLDSNGNFIWLKNYGGTGDDFGFDIRVVENGDHFLTGSFSDTCYFDSDTLVSNGGSDIFVLLVNSNGNIQWSKQTGGPGDEIGWGIDAENINECFVSGSFSNSVAFDTISCNSTGSTDLFVGKLKVVSTGIASLNANGGFDVYPNPVRAGGTITIYSEQNKLVGNCNIYDATGNLVHSKELEIVDPHQKITLPSILPAGIYFIQLLIDNGINLSARFLVVE
jgi:hypothetical protein